MRCALLLVHLVLVAPAVAADLPTATVTGRRGGEEQVHRYGRATTALGLAVAAFGSAQGESTCTRKGWEAFARTKSYVRVRFATPAGLTASAGDGAGKTYSVNELLIDTTPAAKRTPLTTPNGQGYFAAGDRIDPDQVFNLMIRSGDRYYSFMKMDGLVHEPLITLFGTVRDHPGVE